MKAYDITIQVLTTARKLGMGLQMSKKIQKLDFAWFCSIAAPDASKEDLRTLCDWGNWVGSHSRVGKTNC